MIAGDVVLIRFPYSDLSGSKLRPVIVLATLERGDFIACQVTSNSTERREMIELVPASFMQGSLNRASFALPGKLFAAHDSVVTKRVGRLNEGTRDLVNRAVVRIIQGS